MPRKVTALDDFNRATSGDLGPNWTIIQGGDLNSTGAALQNNGVEPGAIGTSGCAEYWTANSFSAKQYAKGRIASFSNGSGVVSVGVLVRANGPPTAPPDPRMYLVLARGASPRSRIMRCDNGFFGIVTLATTDDFTWVVGDIVEIEAEGSTIRMLRNGSVILTATDATYSDGRAGLYVFFSSGDGLVRLDDVEVGEIVGGGGPGFFAPGPRRPRRKRRRV